MSDPSPFLRYLQLRDQHLDPMRPGDMRPAMDSLRPQLTDDERAYCAAQGDWRFTNPPPPSRLRKWSRRLALTALLPLWLLVYGLACMGGAVSKAVGGLLVQLSDDTDDMIDVVRGFIEGLR